MQVTANEHEGVGSAATAADSEQWKCVPAALLCMRANRLSHKMYEDLAIETQVSATRTQMQRLLENAFTVVDVIAARLPEITEERCAFERNERWFVDTVPNLAECHFNQA